MDSTAEVLRAAALDLTRTLDLFSRPLPGDQCSELLAAPVKAQ